MMCLSGYLIKYHVLLVTLLMHPMAGIPTGSNYLMVMFRTRCVTLTIASHDVRFQALNVPGMLLKSSKQQDFSTSKPKH
jgi:hypothetical protein